MGVPPVIFAHARARRPCHNEAMHGSDGASPYPELALPGVRPTRSLALRPHVFALTAHTAVS
jgi:hypothetical protein